MMSSKNLKWQVTLLMLLMGVVAAVPALAGSAVIGSVAGSMNATMSGQAVLPNTTVVSGDSLEVNEGAAVVAVDDTSRMVFGRQTTASFLRDRDEVTVLLTRGSLSMFHPAEGGTLRVRVGSVAVIPARGFKTLGEVAMVGGSVIVTAKEGSLQVEGNDSSLEVAKGKTITIPATSARAPRSSPAKPAAALAGIGWQVASVAAGGTAAALSGVAISRANDARDAANAATTAANGATAAANTADADAKAATAAANTADADALAAGATAAANGTLINSVGCAIDKVNPNVTVNGVKVSPYVPPAGKSCP